ncbi:hypothetical protein ABEB36_003414 [Hypothenemus hampei]|uniref:Uncharacterized protein n=1 Tax=Hypothenemus hampei TaxID=57062 RepID=A0ABD1F914_HYPHA
MYIIRVYAGLLGFCYLFIRVFSKVDDKCNSTEVINDENCLSATELCDDKLQVCVCRPKYENINGDCVETAVSKSKYSSLVDNQGNGSLAAGIIIPLILITIVICIIYVNKKFDLFKWIREKLPQRNRNYDEFMIGRDIDDDDDDSPLP